MATNFHEVTNNAYSTLASGINDVVETFTVATGEGARFPTTNHYVSIGSEIIAVVSRSGDVFTCTAGRGSQSTVAASHLAAAAVNLYITAGEITELQTAVNAVEAYSVLTEQGSIIYRGSSAPTELLHGNSGEFLQSGGHGANPAWAAISRKNSIINGCFRLCQRGGTSFTSATTPANSDDTYLLDRWILLSDGNDIVDVSQVSGGGVSGNDNYIRLDVETAQKKFGILQVIEAKNCRHLIGGTATLSVELKVTNATKLSDIRAVVLAWDSTADIVTSDIISTWNAEGTRPTLVANWTAENTDSNLGVTTSWVKYSITSISIDTASATNIGVFIYQNNVATNDTAGVFLEITKAQLEPGVVATEFEDRPFGIEVKLCQRYYEKSFNLATAPQADTGGGNGVFAQFGAVAGTYLGGGIHFATSKHAAPTVTSYSPVAGGAINQVRMEDIGGGNGSHPAANISSVGEAGFYNWATGAATNGVLLFHWTAAAEL